MDRKEIKELAKSKIKGNLWTILWPILAISAIEGILTSIIAPQSMTTTYNDLATASTIQMSPIQTLLIFVIGLVFGIAAIAYKKYVLNFTRTGSCDFKDILNCMKEKWLNILIAEILVGILVTLATMLLIIPGIILAFAYSMVTYLVVDTNLSGTDAMKESRRIMKGYKLDYFVFGLSFLGWLLLVPLTLGLLLIWLFPYMQVAEAIYYDRLKEKQKLQ